MNRTSIIALAAAAAAVAMAATPAHAAMGTGEGTPGYPHEMTAAVAAPQLSRSEVRAEAARAVADGRVAAAIGEAGTTSSTASPVLTRAQVRAEAAEAVRLGLVATGEQSVVYTAPQLAALKAAADRADRIVVAGQR